MPSSHGGDQELEFSKGYYLCVRKSHQMPTNNNCCVFFVFPRRFRKGNTSHQYCCAFFNYEVKEGQIEKSPIDTILTLNNRPDQVQQLMNAAWDTKRSKRNSAWSS